LGERELLKKLLPEYLSMEDPKLIGVLVGTSITSTLRAKIEQGHVIQGIIPVAALTLARYKGNDNNVYVVTDTFFRNISRKFDKTKYQLDGEVLGKNRLVLSTIRRYAQDHPGLTFASLEKIFPKRLQGAMGCFDTQENAQKILDETGYKRHFLNPDELVELADSKIAVCTQWGIGNIGKFIEAARELGFKIVEA